MEPDAAWRIKRTIRFFPPGHFVFPIISGWHEQNYKSRPGGFYVFYSHHPSPFSARVRAFDRISYDCSDIIRYSGLFSQVAYHSNSLSAFLQLAGSNQGNQRRDYAHYTPPDKKQKSPYVSNWGYVAKAGLGVRIGLHQHLFANGAYHALQPFQGDVFLNFRNDVNPMVHNQTIVEAELGYKFENQNIKAHLNVYNKVWKGRSVTKKFQDAVVELYNGSRETSDMLTHETGIAETHRGVEADFSTHIGKLLSLKGFFSYGD